MTKLFSYFEDKTLLQKGILILFLIAPLLTAGIKSGGSASYAIALLLGLGLAWPTWSKLGKEEKVFLLGFVALFLTGLISLAFTEDLYAGWKKLDRYLRLMTLPLIYMMLVRLNLDVGRFLLTGSIITALFLFFQASYEVHVLGHKVAIGAYYQIALSAFGVFTASIAISAAITMCKNWKQVLACLLASLGGLYAAYLSGGRGSWVAIPVITLLLVWLLRNRINIKQTILAFTAFTVLLISIISINPEIITKRIGMAITEIQLYQKDPSIHTSVGARFNMWDNSIQIWSSHPFFGTGLGDFKQDNNQILEQKYGSEYNSRFTEPHSIYFDALAMTGIVGLIALLWAVLYYPFKIFYHYWKTADDDLDKFYALSGIMIITVFAVAGLTESWLGRNMYVSWYVLSISALASSLYIRSKNTSSERSKSD